MRPVTRFLVTALISATLTTAAVAQPASPSAAPRETRLFELRVYHAAKGKFDALNARLRDHGVRLFAKHGMTNIGYWASEDGSDEKVVFLLAHPDRAARDRAWASLTADPEWQQARRATEARGKLVARIEEVFLTPTDFSPVVTAARSGEPRVFELRVLAAQDGALDQLQVRSKRTVRSLEKDGVSCVGSWTLAPGQRGADSTLVCLLARDPVRARGRGVIDPTLVIALDDDAPASPDVRKTELLRPTDYSPLK